VLLAASASAALVITVLWLFVPAQSPITLNAAEIHLLLPAPFKRREIIQYGVLRSQTSILIVALVLTLSGRPGSPGEALYAAVGLWLALTLWDMHAKARNLTKCRVRDLEPVRGMVERTILFTAPALMGGALALGLLDLGHQLWPVVAGYRTGHLDPAQVLARVGDLSRETWLDLLLLPFRWALSPLILRGETPWVAWLPALGLLFLHHEWVVRSQARFEDESLERERRRGASRIRKRAGLRGLPRGARDRHPFPLRAHGRPEVAVLWKNLLVPPRLGRFQLLALLAATPLAAFTLTAATRGAKPVVFVGGVLAAQLFLLGPFFTAFAWPRNMAADLRRNVEMLRTWPIEAWRLVGAQVTAPLAAAAWVALLGLLWIVGFHEGLRYVGIESGVPILPESVARAVGLPEPLAVIALGGAAAVVLVAAAGVLAAVHAVGALLFPGWVLMMHQQGGGPLAVGHGILAGLVTVLVLGLALVPAALGGGVVAGIHAFTGWGWSALDIPLLVVAMAAPLAAEIHLLIRLGGRLWMRLDPSGEILEH
jgi:hypothetical protein